MDDPEPLVMTHNIKKHCDIIFNRGGVDAINQQSSRPERFHKCIEMCSSHLKHLDSLYIIEVVDVV
jgi:hypothetical protein